MPCAKPNGGSLPPTLSQRMEHDDDDILRYVKLMNFIFFANYKEYTAFVSSAKEIIRYFTRKMNTADHA